MNTLQRIASSSLRFGGFSSSNNPDLRVQQLTPGSLAFLLETDTRTGQTAIKPIRVKQIRGHHAHIDGKGFQIGCLSKDTVDRVSYEDLTQPGSDELEKYTGSLVDTGDGPLNDTPTRYDYDLLDAEKRPISAPVANWRDVQPAFFQKILSLKGLHNYLNALKQDMAVIRHDRDEAQAELARLKGKLQMPIQYFLDLSA